MPEFLADSQKLVEAALETECSPLAIEQGTGLAETWIERGTLADASIVAVECGFVWWGDQSTVIVGVQDLLTRENISPKGGATHHSSEEEEHRSVEDGGVGSVGLLDAQKDGDTRASRNCPSTNIVGNEWKTAKEASKWWNEDKWLEGISEGSQIAIYALALQNGTYYPKVGKPITPAVANPRIRVKAISKSNPPVIWPRRDEDGIITFSPARLEATKQALLSEAESIRARRKKVGLDGTWRIPGHWCVNQFRRTCEFHEDCVKQRPASPVTAFDKGDPAFKLAIPHIDRIDNDLVILSASSYAKSCECAEAYRRGLAREEKESSMALDTGSVFHAVCAEWYRQLQSYRDGNLEVE